MILLAGLGLVAACSREHNLPAAAAQAEAVPTPAPDAASSARVSFPTTSQGFYDSCRGRVEGPSTPGECTSDTHCVASGCSQEMCVSRATAGQGLVGPCERAPCFQVLDRCTCQEGTCSWTVKTELPEPLRALVESTGGD